MGPVGGSFSVGRQKFGTRPGTSLPSYGLADSTGDSSPKKTCPRNQVTGYDGNSMVSSLDNWVEPQMGELMRLGSTVGTEVCLASGTLLEAAILL